jgi:hypothetical protein
VNPIMETDFGRGVQLDPGMGIGRNFVADLADLRALNASKRERR